MKKYFIEEASVEGVGTTIGPSSGIIIGEIKVKDESMNKFYLSYADVDGGLGDFYKTEMSTQKFQIEYDFEDPEGWDTERYGDFLDYVQSNMICGGSIEDVIDEMKDNDLLPHIKYLFYIVQEDWDATEEFIEKTRGHWTDEFEVPELEDDDYDDGEDEE